MTKILTSLAGVMVIMIAGTAQAATVTADGETLDIASPVDVSSAGGTLFWDYSAGPQDSGNPEGVVNNQRNNLPGYVTFGPGAELDGTSGGWNYAQVVDTDGQFESGTLAKNFGDEVDPPLAELATLTFGDNAPSAITIGVVVDNLDSGGFNSADITLADAAAASSATVALVNNNAATDIYWYRLSGISPGDVISVQGSAGANNFATAAGFVVVPEPTAMVLAGVALLGVAIARRRRC